MIAYENSLYDNSFSLLYHSVLKYLIHKTYMKRAYGISVSLSCLAAKTKTMKNKY